MTQSRGIRIRRGTRLEWAKNEAGKHLCQCGCGKPVTILPEAYPTPPKFVHGHNPNPHRLAPNDPCKCGCGEIPKTPRSKWLPGHQQLGIKRSPETRAKLAAGKVGTLNPRYGQRPANYKGITFHNDGYVLVHVPEHPYAMKGNGKVMQHRLVMEEHLRQNEPESRFLIEVDGRLYLRRSFEVHHRNRVKDDNRLENLQVLTKRQHAELHAAERALTAPPPKRVRKKKPRLPEQPAA